jgi:hypothetical protein
MDQHSVVTPTGIIRAAESVAEEWRKDQASLHLANALEFVKTPGAPLDMGADGAKRALHFLAGESSNPWKDWIARTAGVFTVGEMYRDLGISKQEERTKCQLFLAGLERAGEIEQSGTRAGHYRKKEKSLVPVDMTKPEEPRIAMYLPFGLHRDIVLQPKNIVVIAGETNSGKTACLFSLCSYNKSRADIRYLSSEMTPNEVKSRIDAFGEPRAEWENVHFFERTMNFQDAILPHGINIIDFLEVHDNFYAIGGEIKKIFDALTTGVAFIALQKRQGELFGRGGEFSLEKARLGISLFTHGRLPDGIVGSAKITKAKNFIPGRNPDGKEQFYILRNGCLYDNSPLPGVSFQRGFRFYPKRERGKICSEIERYCKHVQDAASADRLEAHYYPGSARSGEGEESE